MNPEDDFGPAWRLWRRLKTDAQRDEYMELAHPSVPRSDEETLRLIRLLMRGCQE